MGTEVAVARERLTERELQILDHLEQAQGLDVPLTENASAFRLDVKDLYIGKAQLVKKGLLPSRTPPPERSDFVPVRVNSSRAGSMCRLTHPSGWVIECPALPEAAWISALMRTSVDAPTRSGYRAAVPMPKTRRHAKTNGRTGSDREGGA